MSRTLTLFGLFIAQKICTVLSTFSQIFLLKFFINIQICKWQLLLYTKIVELKISFWLHVFDTYGHMDVCFIDHHILFNVVLITVRLQWILLFVLQCISVRLVCNIAMKSSIEVNVKEIQHKTIAIRRALPRWPPSELTHDRDFNCMLILWFYTCTRALAFEVFRIMSSRR